jgi:hypothetical protein
VTRFLDVHPTGGVNEDMLKKMQNELPDEFGVTTENIMYNIEDDKVFCLIEAPNKSALYLRAPWPWHYYHILIESK